jgi:hypothetical protein
MRCSCRCENDNCGLYRFEGPLPSNYLRVATPEAFQEAVAADGLIIADFFVPWCIACRRFHPALVKLAAAHPDCTFLSVRGPHPFACLPPCCLHPAWSNQLHGAAAAAGSQAVSTISLAELETCVLRTV